jgi:hypothetical protein
MPVLLALLSLFGIWCNIVADEQFPFPGVGKLAKSKHKNQENTLN